MDQAAQQALYKEIAEKIRILPDLALLGALRNYTQRCIDNRGRTQVRIGSQVEFEHRGEKYTGTVEGINPKTVKVRSAPSRMYPYGQGWRVSPGILRPVAAKVAA